MPRTNRPPSYRLHKARNLAVVTIDGRNHYLGRYGSPESHEKYARLIAEWRANRRHLLPAAAAGLAADRSLSLNELLLAYWRHVEGYYVKDGRPTSEQDNIRQALRFVRTTYGLTPAVDLGPVALKNVRQAMIDAGRSPQTDLFLTRHSRNQRGPRRAPRTLRDSQLLMQFRLMFTRR